MSSLLLYDRFAYWPKRWLAVERWLGLFCIINDLLTACMAPSARRWSVVCALFTTLCPNLEVHTMSRKINGNFSFDAAGETQWGAGVLICLFDWARDLRKQYSTTSKLICKIT